MRNTMRMRRMAAGISAAALLLTAVPVQATAAEETTPGGVKVSELQAEFDKLTADATYADFGMAVFHGDEIVYSAYLGESDCEKHIPADENTVFEWGSITKTLTWVSVLQLAEAGKIDLNADIRGYLPEGFLQYVKYDDPITMLHLMNHTAGWCESFYQIITDNENDLKDLGTMLQNIEPAQTHRPGEVQSYSNYGAALAGYIVERISGESYTDYIRHHIFEPLGMEHTSVGADYRDNAWVREQREKLICYAVQKQPGQKDQPVPSEYPLTFVMPYPAGAACGTLTDIVKFGQALVNPEAPLFQSPETQARIWEGSLFYGDTGIRRTCFGFWPTERNVTAFGHNGQTAGSHSNMEFDPESGWGVVAITNTIAAGTVTEKLPDVIFGKLKTEKYGTDAQPSYDIAGIYGASRSYYRGVSRWIGALSIAPIIKTADGYTLAGIMNLKCIGKDIYMATDADNEPNTVMYADTLPDGTKTLRAASVEYIQNPMLLVQMLLVFVFVVMCIVSAILLIVKFFGRLFKKRKGYQGAGLITLSQLCKVLMIPAIIYLVSGSLGVTKLRGIVFAAAAVLCGLVCALAVCSDFKSMCSKHPEKARAWRYVLNILSGAIAVFTVIYLEMYQFWGC